MRLLKLEMKRILKTRMTVVLLIAAFLLSFVMAWLPTTFSYNSYTDADGNKVELTGLASIRYEKDLQADAAGIVTPEKVRQAVEKYQTCLKKYGVENSYDLPDGVYGEEILPYAPLLHGVREAFADPDTGVAPSLAEINPEEIGDFYGVCGKRIVSLMKQEQEKYPAAQNAAVNLYQRVETPYRLFPGFDRDSMDYQVLLSFLAVLFCTVIAAPVFASDYQTGADDILRCTKYGKKKFAVVKIVSALLICGMMFAVCAVVYIVVTDSLYGWECAETSMQMLYSVVNLPNMDIGQLQIFVAVSGWLCLLATVCFTLFLSSKCKNVAVSLSVALLSVILPMIVYMALPAEAGKWIYGILPSGGVGLQTNILYAAIDFTFWNIGNFAVWLPHGMIAAYLVEIPLFAFLAVDSYSKHTEG